eukprot:1808637-Ditylum_brightwellii.AAC.1
MKLALKYYEIAEVGRLQVWQENSIYEVLGWKKIEIYTRHTSFLHLAHRVNWMVAINATTEK